MTGRAVRVQVFHRTESEPVAERTASAERWAAEPSLPARALDETWTVRVDGAVAEFVRGGGASLEVDAQGLLTIVKFGDTLQRREAFRIAVDFA